MDPYVEFDALTLFIDLILLKPGVYRHLLYNRGTEPKRLGQGEQKEQEKDAKQESSKYDPKEWVSGTVMVGRAVVMTGSWIPPETLAPHRKTWTQPRFLGCLYVSLNYEKSSQSDSSS